MTEKDYLRIKDYNLENIYYLKIGLKIDEKAKFINQILKIYEKILHLSNSIYLYLFFFLFLGRILGIKFKQKNIRLYFFKNWSNY